MVESGFAPWLADQKAKLAPGAEEPDWEDEWDDLTLQQKAPYVERSAAASQAPAPAPPAPKPKPAPAPAASSPRPVASPVKPKLAVSLGAGPSGSRPSPMDSPSGKSRKSSKSGALRKPRSAFELFASQQRKQASDSERSPDDDPPDLGQVSPVPVPAEQAGVSWR